MRAPRNQASSAIKLVPASPEVDGTAVLCQRLQSCTYLRIVVPSRTPESGTLPLKHWTEAVVDLITRLAGGATVLPATGHWLDARGRRVTEPVRIVEGYFTRPLASDGALRLATHLAALARQMRQEALAVVVHHRLFLLRPRRREALLDTPTRRTLLRSVALRAADGQTGGRAS